MSIHQRPTRARINPRLWFRHQSVVGIAALLALAFSQTAGAVLIGPSPYLCFDTATSPAGCGTSDSPFKGLPGSLSYFFLEDFEDHLFNTPGVSASAGGVTSVVFGPSIHDSVDEDDGAIDGSGLLGDTFFSSSGSAGITFSFSAATLSALPTSAGIVWTDGGGNIRFEAFGAGGASLGVLTGTHADANITGETAEDRFYGVSDPGGISAIMISNSSGGIEVDHLQYGGVTSSVPEPATLLLLAIGLAGIGFSRRKTT